MTLLRGVASLLAALGAMACTGNPPRSGAPVERPRVCAVPGVGSRFLLFRRGGVEIRDASRPHAPLVARMPTGMDDPREPVASSVDLFTNWAAVAYEGGLAAVRVGEDPAPIWSSAPWDAPPETLALAHQLAAATSDGTVVVNGPFPDTDRIWTFPAQQWLRDQDSGRLRFAVALGPDELLLVASRENEEVELLRKSRASPEPISRERLRQIPVLQAVTTDGGALFLAGVDEDWRPGGPRQPGRLSQTLVVVRVDLGSGSPRTLVRLERHATSTEVVEIAAGDGLLAIVLQDGELMVFGLDGGGASAPLWESRYRGEFSVAWLSDRAFAIVGPERDVEVVSVR